MSVEEDSRGTERPSYASHAQRQRAVRESLCFLDKKKDYSVAEVEGAREFYVVYEEPSKESTLVISWGYSEVAPAIYFRAGTREDGVAVSLQQVLDRLEIVVDSPASVPFSGEFYAVDTRDEQLHTSSIKSESTPRAQLFSFHCEDGRLGPMPDMTKNDSGRAP